MPQIIHIDIMCNECGNCESFCPYDSEPYHEKFTLFHTIEGFKSSKNQGFLILEQTDIKDITVKVRLGDKVVETSLTNQENKLPQDIAELIQLVYNEYRYILLV